MYQQIIIAGNLGGDPEMRYLPSGDAVTHFSVAAGRQWNDARTGERRKETTWFKVSVFGKQAEPCNQYLSKGKQVLVEGRLQSDPQTGGPRIWTANDGTPRAGYEVRANSVQFLGSRGDTEIRAAGQQ
ncbi:MAG: single-stranded DNA-binding protein [bacterium]|nr:single-stranded DNA-binding protein [bacterium]